MKQQRAKSVKSFNKRLRTGWSSVKKGTIKDEGHLLFSAFIIALVAIVIVNTTYVINRQNAADNQSTVTLTEARPQKVFTSEQTASSPVYKITVSSATENASYDPAFTLADTETMLILNLNITNTSKASKSFIPTQQLYVRSLDGDYANLHASMFVTKPILSGDIAPGKTVSGQVSFNIPKTQARPLLYVDLGWANYTPVVFDVLH